MMRLAWLAVMAMAQSAAGLADAPAHDRLEGPTLPDFVVGYQAANAEQAIREEVPRGENVERWSRMITTQWFAGLTARITPVEFTQLMARNLAGACRSAKVSPPRELTVSDRPAAQIQVDCPLLPATNRPETFIMLVVAGEHDLLVRQVAFRSVPTTDDLEWSDAVLGGTVLCKPRDNDPPCDRMD
jgi:hypothetical protein